MNIKQVTYLVSDLVRMPHPRHLAFMKRSRERAQQYVIDQLGDQCPPKLKAAAQALMDAYMTEDNRYLLSTKSALTEQLSTADQQRDGLLTGLRTFCESMLHLGTAEQQAAARLVLEQISLYKLKPSLKYEDEGIKMDQFLADCQRKADLKQAVKTIGQTDTVAQMKTANDEAMRLVNLRNQQRALTDTQALNKARAATDEAYQLFVLLLNAFAATTADDLGYSQYDLCIQVMNEDIHYYRTMVMDKPKPQKGDDGDKKDDGKQDGGKQDGDKDDDKQDGDGKQDGSDDVTPGADTKK